MRVLVACEYSGVVREAFKAKGHDAVSCDILPTEIPGEHYQGDVMDIINDGWDLMIGHPPCRFLSNAGGHYLKTIPGRINEMENAAEFFNKMLTAKINSIAIENPIQHGMARELIRNYDQKIQPYEFGDSEKKTICLWLKNLPPLIKTCIVPVYPKGKIKKSDGRNYYYWFHQGKSSKNRSKFFKGIAQAMADQWG